MKKSKILFGTSLSAVVLAGIGLGTKAQEVVADDVGETNDSGVILDYRVREMASPRAVYDKNSNFHKMFDYYLVNTVGVKISTVAQKTGVSASYIQRLNALETNIGLYPSGNIYYGALIAYNNLGKTDPKFYYNKSQAKPITITKNNWNKKKSVYVKTNGRYISGKFLNYSLHEPLISVNTTNNTLNLKGWAVQAGYTRTTGTNNQTAIVATKNTPVGGNATNSVAETVTIAKNTNINPTRLFYYNAAVPANASKQCPATDAYLDRHIAFDIEGGVSQSMYGCWHSYNQAGFDANVNLESLFGNGKHNNKYYLYLVNSTGNNEGRVVYKELASRQYITKKFSNSKLSGTLTFAGKGKSLATGTEYQMTDDSVYMMAGASLDTRILGTFKKGKYTIVATEIDQSSGTLYYLLDGKETATKGYKGWAPQNLLDDDTTPAELSFKIDEWEKFNLNYVAEGTGKVLKNPTTFTVYAEGTSAKPKSVTVKTSVYGGRVTDSNGVVWRLAPVSKYPNNKDFTKTFNATTPPTDHTYTFTNNYNVNVNYINANTGQVIRTVSENITFGVPKTFNHASLGTSKGNNIFNYNGRDYKFAGTGLKSYASEYASLYNNKLKNDLTKYGNTATQTRTFNATHAVNGMDDINFYFYEPQSYTVNHVRTDSTNNWVDANGNRTSNLATARISQESGWYYTGESVPIHAYDVEGNSKTGKVQTGRGNYRFAGRGKFERSQLYVDGQNMASGKTSIKLPLAKIASGTWGSNAYLNYRRIVSDPSGEIEFGVDPANPTPSNPNGTGVSGTKSKFSPTVSGQYNWYLTKEQGVDSNNWDSSKLAMTNTGTVGNEEVFAVRGVTNTLALGDESKLNYTKAIGDSSEIYYGKNSLVRKVVPMVGEGYSASRTNPMKLSKNFGVKNHALISTFYDSRKYSTIANKVAMNSKLYDDSVQNNYNSSLDKVAGKESSVIYNTLYSYTNRIRDTYSINEQYGGNVFSWKYEYTTPVFKNDASDLFNFKVISKVDHKLNEDKATPLAKAGDKIVSKVGIYRNYTNQGANNARDTMNTGSTNSVVLNETIEKVETINPTLNTQSKVKAEESIRYTNDILKNNALTTVGASGFTGYRDSFNGFTYNSKGYNKYLVPDVDFQYRDKESATDNSNINTKKSNASTALENDSRFKYQMGIKMDNLAKLNFGTTSQTVKLNLDNQYGVLSDSGLLIERPRGQALDNQTLNASYYKAVMEDQFELSTGKGYEISNSDKLVKQSGNYVSYYYIPVDGKSALKNNTTYTNRNVISQVGLSDMNIAVDNTFKFNKYLVGSSLDETTYASFKTNLTKNGTYSKNKVVITSKEKDAIKDSEVLKSRDEKNFRALNAKEITNTLKKFIGFGN